MTTDHTASVNRFTDGGIEIKPCYFSHKAAPEKPGEFPFTRGIRYDMYRGKLWTMRQYAGFSTAKESNKRYHYLLSQGTTGLSVAFDLPTQIGYDSDHSLSDGEVGKVGVAIDSLADMEILFEGIRLENITTSMTINATASILLAMYVALAKKQGADLNKLSGTIQNDILKEYAARGTYIYPARQSMRLITDIFEWCGNYLPKWNTISISGYHIREAGSTAEQELAFTLANGKAYVKAAIAKGLNINNFGKRLSFFFNAHNNFFEEIAKFRAARRIWANMMKEMGATDDSAMMLRFHTQTGGSTLTAGQPENNIVRVSLQSLAAILGGTQSLHTNGFDEALSLPTENAAKIALRTQQIIAHESAVTDTTDPLGGSYFIETLTDELESKVYSILNKIDEMGGSVAAIENGWIQQQIASSSYAYQKSIESKKRIIVGVNDYIESQEGKIPLLRVDDNIRIAQTEALNKIKTKRDNLLVETTIKAVEETAKNGGNLMPVILDAVESYATLGEIANAMRRVFGEYKE
jgi:methylmalonyl-CoA mutase N-terminal domain/subunit